MTSKEAFEKWYGVGWDSTAAIGERDAWQAALEWAASQQKPLPDDLYPGSKDWKHSNYAGRVEWLHSMYESKKKEADFWVDVANKNIPEAECQARIKQAKREALLTVLAEWEKPYGLTDGTSFIERLRRMAEELE